MNGWETQTMDISNSFDQDYGKSTNDIVSDYKNEIDMNKFSYYFDGAGSSNSECFHHQDPLKHCYKHQFKPLHLNTGIGDTHFVRPHQVDGYYRGDGTYVDSYYRDGDGDTSINRGVQQGGGYYSR